MFAGAFPEQRGEWNGKECGPGRARGSSLDEYGRTSQTTSLSLSLFPVAARVTVDTGVEPDNRGFLVSQFS